MRAVSQAVGAHRLPCTSGTATGALLDDALLKIGQFPCQVPSGVAASAYLRPSETLPRVAGHVWPPAYTRQWALTWKVLFRVALAPPADRGCCQLRFGPVLLPVGVSSANID